MPPLPGARWLCKQSTTGYKIERNVIKRNFKLWCQHVLSPEYHIFLTFFFFFLNLYRQDVPPIPECKLGSFLEAPWMPCKLLAHCRHPGATIPFPPMVPVAPHQVWQLLVELHKLVQALCFYSARQTRLQHLWGEKESSLSVKESYRITANIKYTWHRNWQLSQNM